jgi:hypothetical protein
MADLSITAANVAADGNSSIEHGTAGAAITAGQVVFKDTNQQYQLADADDVALDEAYGIALNDAASGQPLTVALSGGNITIGATLTAGTAYYLSGNAGGIAPVADLATGDRVILLGMASSTTVLKFRPFDSGVILA